MKSTVNVTYLPNGGILGGDDSEFLAIIRTLSIVIIVFGHVGGFWFWRPYSEFLHVTVPMFFFIAGAVAYPSYLKCNDPLLYIKKRVVQLIVPYYIFCLVCLFVVVINDLTIKSLSGINFFNLLTVIPPNDKIPFVVNHVWFLRSLLVISIISPFFLKLNKKYPIALYGYICLVFGLSVLQLKHKVSLYFVVGEHTFFNPIVFSGFFVLGFLFFQHRELHRKSILIYGIIASLLLSFVLVRHFSLDIDYFFHTSPPDAYYVTGSFAFILAVFLCREIVVYLYRSIPGLSNLYGFIFKHTMSIYLLHTIAIYLVEKLLSASFQKTNFYGAGKFFFVMIVVCILAVPFTRITKKFVNLF